MFFLKAYEMYLVPKVAMRSALSIKSKWEKQWNRYNVIWLVETKLPRCHEAELMIKFISFICQTVFRNLKAELIRLWSLLTDTLCKACDEFTYYLGVVRFIHGAHMEHM
jgi:hypothetical protein